MLSHKAKFFAGTQRHSEGSPRWNSLTYWQGSVLKVEVNAKLLGGLEGKAIQM
jgi:hypothetical protein